MSASETGSEVRSAGRPRGWARALSGTLASGMVLLTAGLFLAWWLAAAEGAPGPGPVMLAGHLAGALLAVVLHQVALRRSDALGYLAAFGVPAVLLLLGILFWWS